MYHYCEQNKQVSEKECRALLQNLRDTYLNPILKNLSPETKYADVVNAVDIIQENYWKRSIGPAKTRMHNEFMKVSFVLSEITSYNCFVET